jgi:hypothetical protein
MIMLMVYLVSGASNNGGKDGSGSIVSGKSGLAHARAIVNHQCSYVLVTHVDPSLSG